MRAVRILVRGLVQGVSFRYYARQEARSLNLRGWVRNTSGGEVVIQAKGEEPDIIEFIAWCKKGSPGADVSEVDVNEIEGFEVVGFEVRY